MQTIAITLSFMRLETVSRRISSITFPGIEVRLIGLWFPRSSSWKDKWSLLSSSLQELPPVTMNHSKIIKSGLAVTTATSLCTSGYNPSGPIDLQSCVLHLKMPGCKSPTANSYFSSAWSSTLWPWTLRTHMLDRKHLLASSLCPSA